MEWKSQKIKTGGEEIEASLSQEIKAGQEVMYDMSQGIRASQE